VGYERRFNDALLIKDKAQFVAYMQDEQPLKPANVLNIVATNQGQRPLTMETPRARPLTAAQVAEMMAEGVAVVDARASAVFGAGHIPGAYNVQLSSGEFEQRVGWIVPDNTSIILVTDNDAQAQEAVFKMAFVALDASVVGFLEGGIEAWMNAGKALATVPQLDVHTLNQRLQSNGLRVLDVRSTDEWDDGHIEDARLLPYTSLVPQLDVPARIDELPFEPAQSIAVTCATGQRSSTAISVLARAGFQNLYNVTGGMEAWGHAGFKMLDGEGQVCAI
jgi:hydroxyacylglutathione hydrolase